MPITTFNINEGDIFDDLSTQSILDDVTQDHFSALNIRDPILIINPCKLTDINFRSQNAENPYVIEDAEAMSNLQNNLFNGV